MERQKPKTLPKKRPRPRGTVGDDPAFKDMQPATATAATAATGTSVSEAPGSSGVQSTSPTPTANVFTKKWATVSKDNEGQWWRLVCIRHDTEYVHET